MTEREMVEEFYAYFGETPDPEVRIRLRADLLEEEMAEVDDALWGLAKHSVEHRLRLAKELQDLKYDIYGLEMALGIESSVAFAEVHRSNMSKLGEDGKPVLRDDGKILKGPNYREPDLRGALGLD